MAVNDKVRRMARECVAVRVRLLNRLVTGICDDGLRPWNVRVAQVNILVAAANVGPISAKELAEMLVLDKSTLSRDAAKLLEKGWLETIPAPDSRGQALQVTEQGLAFLDEIHPVWQAAQRKIQEELGRTLVAAVGDRVDGFWAARRASRS